MLIRLACSYEEQYQRDGLWGDMEKLKSIYEFVEFREYLKHYLDYQKSTKGVTQAQWAGKAGLNSASHLTMVLSGRRQVTVESIHQFAQAMALKFSEREYLEAMVLKEQTSTDEQKNYYMRKLRELKKRKNTKVQKVHGSEIYKNALLPAVIACLGGTKRSLKDLVRMTGAKRAQIEEALEVLLSSGYAEKRDAEYWVEARSTDMGNRKGLDIRFKKFQQEQLQKSREALEKKVMEGAKFYSLSFTIEKARQQQYADRISEFISELSAETDQDPPEELMQLNIQYFTYK